MLREVLQYIYRKRQWRETWIVQEGRKSIKTSEPVKHKTQKPSFDYTPTHPNPPPSLRSQE
jgi:hypothetical protein